MKKIILTLMLFFLILPLVAKEKTVFESVLKDAEFHPLYEELTKGGILTSRHYGCWTLKFDNGAVIRIYKGFGDLPKDDIWFIGKKYKITRKGFGKNDFFVYLNELVGIEWVDKQVQKRLDKEAKKKK